MGRKKNACKYSGKKMKPSLEGKFVFTFNIFCYKVKIKGRAVKNKINKGYRTTFPVCG